MNKKVYHLANCDTCQRILKEVDKTEILARQNIKEEKISAVQLDAMKKISGSYESLFSKRARKYRSLGLNEKKLTEKDYRKYILDEYTFLKRPVFIIDHEIFIGNSKKTVEAITDKLKQ